jgi:hypothetical protein
MPWWIGAKESPVLLFKKKFLPAICSGRKTQTIRLWPHRRMRAGQRSYIPGVGYIRVEAVESIRLRELTQDDAVADGFSSVASLRAELRRIYPNPRRTGRSAFRVRFRLEQFPQIEPWASAVASVKA